MNCAIAPYYVTSACSEPRLSPPSKRLIHARATVAELWQVAVAQGMTTLVQDGVQKVLAGWTDYGQVRAAATR